MMAKDMNKHRHDKKGRGQIFETVKGKWVEKRQQRICSVCHTIMDSVLLGKVESPLRKRMGDKAGKMVWFDDKGKGK